jgi:hypothetical protein
MKNAKWKLENDKRAPLTIVALHQITASLLHLLMSPVVVGKYRNIKPLVFLCFLDRRQKRFL